MQSDLFLLLMCQNIMKIYEGIRDSLYFLYEFVLILFQQKHETIKHKLNNATSNIYRRFTTAA